jgi:hypothetical protein
MAAKGQSMKRDTPKIPRNIKWIWMAMLPLCTLINTPANAVEKIEIDKYKIYIHLKVLSYKEFVCIEKLWTLENRLWDPYAKNKKSSAFGIPQLLKLKETNPYVQMDLGYKYIVHRYKTPCNALAFHLKYRYY